MKRLLFICSLLFFAGIANAQYTILHNFNDTSGANPHANLIFSGNKLYGMASHGGASGDGCIFYIDTNGHGYKDMFDFDSINGQWPQGSLVLFRNKLYGMTAYGGLYNDGCVFSIDTNGGSFKKIFEFSGANGANPFGSLIISRATLYGMTAYGGPNNYGCIFSIDTNGYGFKDLSINANVPFGSLLLSGGILYGTETGYPGTGQYSDGDVFGIDTNGNYAKFLFGFGPNYSTPKGSLILSGSKLYGMTSGAVVGGNNIFSIDTNGNNYKDLIDFNNFNGSSPSGSLIISSDTLYGMTAYGGINGEGVIFSIDTNGSGYKALLDFNGVNGANPYGDITLLGGILYGMTANGGVNGDGVIFSFNPKGWRLIDSINVISKIRCFDSTATASVKIFNGTPPYKYNWSPGGITSDTATRLKSGTYTVNITDAYSNSVMDSVTIIQPTSSSLKITTSSLLSGCKANKGVASVNVSGGVTPYSYSWYPSGGMDSIAKGLSVGYYTCSIIDSVGCSRNEEFNIKDSGTLYAVISPLGLKCFGDSSGIASASISGGTKPYTYLWYPNGGTNSIAQNLSAGNYTLTVTDSNGCVADTFATVIQPTQIKITPTPYLGSYYGICNGVLWVDVTGGNASYSYLWTGGLTTDTIYHQCHGAHCCMITDMHGCRDSTCIIITDTTLGIAQTISNTEAIRIYPNPNNGKFTFQAVIEEGRLIAEIYNMFGEKIYSAKLNATTTQINMSNNAAGIYLYRVVTETGNLVSEGKIVIQK